MKLDTAKAFLGVGLTLVAYAVWLGYIAYTTRQRAREATTAKLILNDAFGKRAKLLQEEGIFDNA